MKAGSYHPSEVGKRLRKAFCPEKDPGKGNLEKGQITIFPSRWKKGTDHRINTMEQPPYHEVQTGAMPHATEQKNDHGIPAFPEGAAPVAAKRDINIVLQKAAKGNMPPSPEFRNGSSLIRRSKILRQVYSEDGSTANGDIGIACKITIDLHGIKEHAKEQEKAVKFLHTAKEAVYQKGQAVGHDHFHKVAPQDIGESSGKPSTVWKLHIRERRKL